MKNFTRYAARLSLLVAAVTLGSLVVVQFESIASRYLSLRQEVDDTQNDIVALKAKVKKEQNDVRRLSDPRGAVPEIHERLKEFAPDEEVIYLRGLPSPAPGAWENSR